VNLAATSEAVAREKAERVEIVMPLTPAQLKGLSEDLEQLAKRFDLPSWASNTELIVEAVHRQAHPK
jgi:hypothetical protein